MQEPVNALIQSYTRTKARDYAGVPQDSWSCTPTRPTTRSSPTPTGNIAYFHSNYIPRRDTSFDWTKPVDGSNPATE